MAYCRIKNYNINVILLLLSLLDYCIAANRLQFAIHIW